MNNIFAELEGMEPEHIAQRMAYEELRMPHPDDHSGITRTCVLAQWIKRRTGKKVDCGTTSFNFIGEEGLKFLPTNVSIFCQGTFMGKYPELYLPRKSKADDFLAMSRWADDGGSPSE